MEYYAKTLCAHIARPRGAAMRRWSSKDLAGMLAGAPALQQKLAGLEELWRWVVTDADTARRGFSLYLDRQDKPTCLQGGLFRLAVLGAVQGFIGVIEHAAAKGNRNHVLCPVGLALLMLVASPLQELLLVVWAA